MRNQEIIKALKACRPYLWTGGELNGSNKPSNICGAIEHAYRNNKIGYSTRAYAAGYVCNQLGKFSYAHHWLAAQDGVEIPRDGAGFITTEGWKLIQAWRFRWIDKMIKDLS